MVDIFVILELFMFLRNGNHHNFHLALHGLNVKKNRTMSSKEASKNLRYQFGSRKAIKAVLVFRVVMEKNKSGKRTYAFVD